MELEIDFAITSKYSDYHNVYSQNLKIFKSFVRVFESFFKKEKYQNSEIKIDEDAKDKATITFCSKKYQLSLVMDPADLNSALLSLARINKEQLVAIGEVVIDNSENIIFPVGNIISLKDNYEFNNAVLNFFIAGATKKPD
ncbi:MAG: hypothetical protein WCL37_00475 [Chrysiogenales bacterium]